MARLRARATNTMSTRKSLTDERWLQAELGLARSISNASAREDNVSPHYETAAHTLLFLCRSGLTIPAGVDSRTVIARIAYMMDLRRKRYKDLSHAAAAIWIIDDLLRLKYVAVDAKQRVRLLAILGTSIGNADVQSRRAFA